MNRTFTVTEDETERIYKWFKEKEAERAATLGEKPKYGAIGGELTYEFTPTGLGNVFIVRYFDQELNLTDYASW